MKVDTVTIIVKVDTTEFEKQMDIAEKRVKSLELLTSEQMRASSWFGYLLHRLVVATEGGKHE